MPAHMGRATLSRSWGICVCRLASRGACNRRRTCMSAQLAAGLPRQVQQELPEGAHLRLPRVAAARHAVEVGLAQQLLEKGLAKAGLELAEVRLAAAWLPGLALAAALAAAALALAAPAPAGS